MDTVFWFKIYFLFNFIILFLEVVNEMTIILST